jgi:MFS transporter, ACS family, DAL5 transporter family protein
MSSPVRPQVSEVPLSGSEKSLPTHDEGSEHLPTNSPAAAGPLHHTFTHHDPAWAGDDVDISSVDERAVLRKMDLRLMPMLTLLYLLSFLDRGNIGNAKIEGLVESLHMTEPQYNWCLTVFFFTYCAFEVPSNLMQAISSPKALITDA